MALVAGTAGARSPALAVVASDSVAEEVADYRTAPAGDQRVMVVGNSVGLFLGQAMKEPQADLPIATANRALIGCTFPTPERVRLGNGELYPSGEVDCTGGWTAEVARLRPELVVFAIGDPGDADYEYRSEWLHPCQPAYDEWYRSSLERAIDDLSATGATVAVVTPAYSQVHSLPRCATNGPTA